MRAEPIAGMHAILDRFDHVLLDQWGALHEGKDVLPDARAAVLRLRAAGKRVLVLSNSGRRAADNVKQLATLGLAPDEYDGMLSSGEAAWHGLKDRRLPPYRDLGRSCFLISRNGSHSVIEGLDIAVAPIDVADFILLAGIDDAKADPAAWADVLRAGAARRLPMLCVNPDFVMFSAAGTLVPSSGSVARLYKELGGQVAYVGKPHRPIFSAALHALGDPDPGRVLMIGDSLDHDVAGGLAAGLLTLLLTDGVHKETLRGISDLPRAIRDLAGDDGNLPHWIMDRLKW